MKILTQEELDNLVGVYNKRSFLEPIKNLEVGQSLQISIEELNGADPHYPVVILWRMKRKLKQKKLKNKLGYVYTRLT